MSRSNPCEPIDEPCTRRTVPLAGCVTERFSARNSFLPFDVVQCSWLGCRVVVTVLMKSLPLLAAIVRRVPSIGGGSIPYCRPYESAGLRAGEGLAPLEHWRALLDHGAGRLAGVLGVHQLRAVGLLASIALLDRHELDFIEGFLAEAQPERRLVRDRAGQLARGFHQPLPRHHHVGEIDAV